ncbi:RHS repeat-associated core domain-containing protein [Vibrio sp. V15_P4S5T153]|uniref:RHS repeat-associated core domain-containing protein n=1 Tax=Vibrio sp. V15_P4S5T153 TaxID=1938669 RepID=UPI000B8F32BC|nr:RHS repeat-associated core domain-containing protein [Vibrio sp. V15_P4S5T153]OXX62401.1 type IV secretion protein Rhs [Vibrio sp. V15_P4S5T153]
MEENINGTSFVHEYDEHGRHIGSSGSKTARQYQWTKHQLQQLSVGEHTPLQFAYHPSGHEKTRATEQGFSLHHQWSETGLLLEQQLGRNGDSLRQYQYDALDRLVGINDAKRGNSRFSLNANGQVQAERLQKGWDSQYRFVHLFGYDSELNLNQQGFATEYGDSNVVSLDDARVKRQSRQYDKAGRVLDTGRFRYHYDRCGRVVEKTEYQDGFRPKTTRFVWNGDDRLTHIELPDGGRYRYRYDPLGRRIAKECLSSQRITEYLWDGANIVQHSQKTADGSVVQTIEYLYEPESFRPLAQVTHKANQASQLHYIVTDHAGTPQELCSENGEVVWQGEQALWGHYQQRNALPNHGFRENAHNDELYCDLRYQGQIEDRESGLYYNVNRYYDADSGQYLSPDPIGFAGGLRPQAYVFNPLDWVDPLGLTSCELAKKMEDSGVPRPKNSAAHHIVGETSKGAKPARDILKKHDIDINGADNGVFLPNKDNTSDMPGILHNGRHPNDYLKSVNDRITIADTLGGKQAVLDELSAMRSTLSSADRNASWYTVLN